jgi:hypothetical protein
VESSQLLETVPCECSRFYISSSISGLVISQSVIRAPCDASGFAAEGIAEFQDLEFLIDFPFTSRKQY